MNDDDWQDDDFGDDEPISCPACGHSPTRSRHCGVCGGEGTRELQDAPEEWGEDIMAEENRLIGCRECDSTGIERWCPKCGADYWRAKRDKERSERKAKA
jgi:hypothetical protein